MNTATPGVQSARGAPWHSSGVARGSVCCRSKRWLVCTIAAGLACVAPAAAAATSTTITTATATPAVGTGSAPAAAAVRRAVATATTAAVVANGVATDVHTTGTTSIATVDTALEYDASGAAGDGAALDIVAVAAPRH